jgi:hypothetical protein
LFGACFIIIVVTSLVVEVREPLMVVLPEQFNGFLRLGAREIEEIDGQLVGPGPVVGSLEHKH